MVSSAKSDPIFAQRLGVLSLFPGLPNACSGLTTEESRLDNRHGQQMFSTPKHVDRLCPTNSPGLLLLVHGERSSSPAVKGPESESDHLLPSNAEMKSWVDLNPSCVTGTGPTLFFLYLMYILG